MRRSSFTPMSVPSFINSPTINVDIKSALHPHPPFKRQATPHPGFLSPDKRFFKADIQSSNSSRSPLRKFSDSKFLTSSTPRNLNIIPKPACPHSYRPIPLPPKTGPRTLHLRPFLLLPIDTPSEEVDNSLRKCSVDTITGYDVQFRATPSDGTQLKDVTANEPWISVTLTLPFCNTGWLQPDLVPASTYECRVRSVNDFGFSEYSEATAFRTMNEQPDSPNPPSLVNRTDCLIRIKWQKPERMNGLLVDEFNLQMRIIAGVPTIGSVSASNLPATAEPSAWKDVFESSSCEKFMIPGLFPVTAYQFRIRAHNSLGWGPFSKESAIMRTRRRH
eukprot:TRINITY_DN3040_c0_g1_i1.p1 TRINITY_DN3040_c0_g1~~TRINITY_DN3040_c0_g1_i1.p1  ORF type:complete len:333 (-),score=60.43 TRINITY_DN3040_c0_g1_i1:154-1152(-)